jgi:hypothetical protein
MNNSAKLTGYRRQGTHGKGTETSGPEPVCGISVGIAKKVVRD